MVERVVSWYQTLFDIWHIARTTTKKLLRAAKEKDCKVISRWIPSIQSHIYWCATSRREGFDALILEKWKSFMTHVQNQNDSHPDSLFKACAHRPLEQKRAWVKNGYVKETFRRCQEGK